MWLLLTLFFANLYGGEFYSKMTVFEHRHTIDTVEDLIFALSTEKYSLKSIPLFQNYIRNANSDQPIFYAIAKFINRTNRYETISTQSQSHKMMSNFSKNIIFITAKMNFKMLKAQYGLNNKLHVSKDSLSKYSMGIALQKRSPLLEPFNIM